MIEKYFQEWEVKKNFNKEFISIFNGWLGEANLHKLDEVTDKDWFRFNILLKILYQKFDLYLVNQKRDSVTKVKSLDSITSTLIESQNKESSEFLHLIIPALDCVVSEDWDFTFILWYRDNAALNAIAKLVEQAGLYHFNG